MATIAEQIAEKLGNDGQSFESKSGETLDEMARAAGAELSYKQRGIAGEPVRYDFADGSSIVTAGPAWDLGLPDAAERDCFCWAGADHGRHQCDTEN